jgi:transcriptional regulator with XRE-family HTH domain
MMTGEQIRAARALARIDQMELARRSGVSAETIKRLERIRGPVEAHARTLRAIRQAFQEFGVEMVSEPDKSIGVRLSSPGSMAGAPAGDSPRQAPDDVFAAEGDSAD